MEVKLTNAVMPDSPLDGPVAGIGPGGTAPGVERSATRSRWQPVDYLAINWPVEPVGPAEPFFGARSEIAVIVFVAVTVRKLLRLA